MASGEQLRQLFRGFVRREDAAFYAAAEAIIKEERNRNHRLLADDLERILRGGPASTKTFSPISNQDVPKDRERGFPLFTIEAPDISWDRLVVSSKARVTLVGVEEEYRRRDVLYAAGIRPRQRLLFSGPPGCGKTLAAKVMASALSLPLITVRFDAVISSYLGETAANLRRVFEYVERGEWVVLFDEFDVIGKERDNPFEHGELKRVVSSLLQLMDAYQGESLLVAATNHWTLLDSAVWRRFDAVVPFSLPTMQDRVLILRLFLRSFDTSSVDFEAIARQAKEATGADLERIALHAVRQAALAGRYKVDAIDLKVAVLEFRERLRLQRESAFSQQCSKDDTGDSVRYAEENI